MAMEGIEGAHVNGRSTDDGLMSPLMLGEDSANPSGGFQYAAAPNVRSPTPEPEEMASTHLSGSDSSNPGHQPYLGRVDELDTGPLPSTATINGNGHAADHEDPGAGDGAGAGEGGNMTPHGMSDRPVPISSTTTERRVAGIPRSGLRDRFVAGQSEEKMEKEE